MRGLPKIKDGKVNGIPIPFPTKYAIVIGKINIVANTMQIVSNFL